MYHSSVDSPKPNARDAVHWKVGQLARQTGLSVRTLHHYDKIGLLSPSYRTRTGHRLYARADILRLQQIVSLKQLGFSLNEIRDCFNREGFSPQRVIHMHISHLKGQIERQTRLCARLEAIAACLDSAREVSVEDLMQTIEVTTMMEKYYTPEQQKELSRRAQIIGEDRIRQSEKEWAALIEQVRAEMDSGTDPASPVVQQLAQRWMGLLREFTEFTGGDPGIQKSVSAMWRQEETIHGFDTAGMRAMMGYINKAVTFNKSD